MIEEKKKRKPPRDRIVSYDRMMREYNMRGSQGAAGPCKKIDPKTGEVIEVIPAKERVK